jgi:prepilin-type processing-associated H-X9-DG protein
MRGRRAFTMAELLVVVGIILLLASMILPAVQTAREGARRTICRSNLKQLALAVHNYLEVHSMMPGVQQIQRPIFPGAPRESFQSSYPSVHAQILPYLGFEGLYDQMNWQSSLRIDFSATAEQLAPFTTVSRTRIALFLCPSDSGIKSFVAPNSYRGNQGVGPDPRPIPEFPDSGNGVFCTAGLSPYPVKMQSFIDGVGRTAMFSERFVGSGAPNFQNRERDVYLIRVGIRTASAAVLACAATANLPEPGSYSLCGKSWLFSGIHHTAYTHAMTPNSTISDCLAFTIIPSGLTTARSSHGGSVNVVMADGSVQSVTQNVDLNVWRALGTRAGGETSFE